MLGLVLGDLNMTDTVRSHTTNLRGSICMDWKSHLRNRRKCRVVFPTEIRTAQN